MKQDKITQIIFIIAGVLTLGGAILETTQVSFAPYVFVSGTLLLIYCHLKNILSAKEDNFRQKRLARLGFISSLMLLISNYFMFTSSNAWVVFLLIYAVIIFFLSFRTD